ncbi:SpaH/EbpB family LPXTG-anchored major pilin [Tannockella kyphosi]|uniref:SpaH/EbpB family LPXTG-anchored major pilin n=1 Tax=Tannockella kyphosi TaxID=2899121 RepID=UPI002011A66D|nr:SpaH/EbpB family LPXTG-anchored major pilin [Tannockella kyphosi]
MKKLLKVLLVAFVFLTSMTATGVSTFATTSGDIVVTNDPAETSITIVGKDFAAYRIFDITVGTNDDGDTVITSWDFNGDFGDFFTGTMIGEDANEYVFTDLDDDAKVGRALELVNTYADNMTAFYELMTAFIDANGITADYTLTGAKAGNLDTEEAVASDVELGYYIVVDTTAEPGVDGIVVAGMMDTVTGDLDIAIKSFAPTVSKQIKDNDDDSWQDVADNQIGDDVEFLLTGTLPSLNNLEAYSSYYYAMTDTLSEGLSYNDGTIVIYTDYTAGTVLDSEYYSLSVNEENDGFTVEFNVEDIVTDTSASHVYVYYTAELTTKAALDFDKNTNTVVLDFSNNPYDSSDKGQSEDEVYDYTFSLDVFKTTADGETALADATFALFEGDVQINLILIDEETNTYAIYDGEAADLENGGQIVTDETGLFTIVGLDDVKTYTIKETAAPEGYNAIDPIEFVISATYNETTGALETLVTDSAYISETDLAITIRNTTNSLLPSTGGMGTVIFYGAGAVIMVGAVVLFLKSRKEEEKN